jgi:hypothetical protein
MRAGKVVLGKYRITGVKVPRTTFDDQLPR